MITITYEPHRDASGYWQVIRVSTGGDDKPPLRVAEYHGILTESRARDICARLTADLRARIELARERYPAGAPYFPDHTIYR